MRASGSCQDLQARRAQGLPGAFGMGCSGGEHASAGAPGQAGMRDIIIAVAAGRQRLTRLPLGCVRGILRRGHPPL